MIGKNARGCFRAARSLNVSCTRYRNDNCRVLNACYMAMFDKSKFPYDDLEQNGIIRCKHYTEEPLVRHKRPFEGQISIWDCVEREE